MTYKNQRWNRSNAIIASGLATLAPLILIDVFLSLLAEPAESWPIGFLPLAVALTVYGVAYLRYRRCAVRLLAGGVLEVRNPFRTVAVELSDVRRGEAARTVSGKLCVQIEMRKEETKVAEPGKAERLKIIALPYDDRRSFPALATAME